jgi:hypothetical protein
MEYLILAKKDEHHKSNLGTKRHYVDDSVRALQEL